MTRLTSDDIEDVWDGARLDTRLEAATGRTVRELAMEAAGLPDGMDLSSFSVVSVPITSGLGEIGGFAQSLDAIARHLGMRSQVSHVPDVSGFAAAVESGADIVIGSRFITVKKPKSLRMAGSYLISWAIRLTTGKAICDPTSGMRMFNRKMLEEFAANLNYAPEPDTISYLIKNGAVVKELQVEMGERIAGTSYLNFARSVEYMIKMGLSILLIQWFRKRDTETPYPERSL